MADHRSTDRVLDLSRDEQWVIHAVMVDRMEAEAQADRDETLPPLAVYRVFDKLEAGTFRFSHRERRCIVAQLERHLASATTPERDRPVAAAILDRLGETDSAAAATESVA